METSTVLPKFQVVIPCSVRNALDIHPSGKRQVMQYKDLIPEARKPLKASLTSMMRRNSRVELYTL